MVILSGRLERVAGLGLGGDPRLPPLAAQYESFRDPAVMLVSVPMLLAGALVLFALGVASVNIYNHIGLLALALALHQ